MHIIKTDTYKVWYLLFFIFILSLTLNIYHNNFSINFHADEALKIHLIRGTLTPFLHPMLMVQLAKIAKSFLPADNLEIGRCLSAICGSITVLLTYYIAKKSFKNDTFALLTALAVAVSPILVIHSHYLKESIYFTMCELFFLLQLINYTNKQSLGNTLLLGGALGASIASEYIGCLSLFLLLALPFLTTSIEKKSYFKQLVLVGLIASGTFLIINYPLLFNPQQFWAGFNRELVHAEIGHHDVKMYPWDFYWSFHLLYSIIPGITLIVTVLAIIGLMLTLCNWKNESIVNKILFLYVILYYFVEESSPLKPYPDFQRYMLFISPVLIFFAALTLHRNYLRFYPQKNNLTISIVTVLFTSIIVYPLYISTKLDYYLTNDTRTLAENWIMATKQNFLYSKYSMASNHKTLRVGTNYDSIFYIIKQAKAQHARYLITSSFTYQRYLDALNGIPEQTPEIYAMAKVYLRLFNHFHFVEFKPAFHSIAFSNPTVRIIDLQRPKQ